MSTSFYTYECVCAMALCKRIDASFFFNTYKCVFFLSYISMRFWIHMNGCVRWLFLYIWMRCLVGHDAFIQWRINMCDMIHPCLVPSKFKDFFVYLCPIKPCALWLCWHFVYLGWFKWNEPSVVTRVKWVNFEYLGSLKWARDNWAKCCDMFWLWVPWLF